MVASVTYALTTICVAIVFAIFGQERVDRPSQRVSAPRFAISHSGELVYLADSREEITPAWTPSGLEIAFAISKAGPFNLAGPWHEFPTSWSPDGTYLAFTEYQPLTGADIWVLDRRTRTRRPLVRTVFDESWARFSPDGRWIAYMSNESGRWDVYLQSSSGLGGRVRVSSSGGAWPSWSNDGATVYFTAGGNTMASAIRTESGLAAAAPAIVQPGSTRGHAPGRSPHRPRLVFRAGVTRPTELIALPNFVRIDTLDDPRVADYRHIADLAALNARAVFVAEGRLVVRRLLDLQQWPIESILLTQPAASNLADVLDKTSAPIYLVEQSIMNALAGFNIHRGCLALVQRPATPTLERTAAGPLSRVLVLEGVNNPDNVGGLFRSAAAFGVELVVLGPECGDPLYRKAIRTSMAATLMIPFAYATQWPGAIRDLRTDGFTVVALTPNRAVGITRGSLPALKAGAPGRLRGQRPFSRCPADGHAQDPHSDDGRCGLAKRHDGGLDCDVSLLRRTPWLIRSISSKKR